MSVVEIDAQDEVKVEIKSTQVLLDGEIVLQTDEPMSAIIIEGDVDDLVCHNAVIVKGDVKGDIETSGSVECEDVKGDIRANGDIECEDVDGDVNEGTLEKATSNEGQIPKNKGLNVLEIDGEDASISCEIPLIIEDGDVLGDLKASGFVRCEDVKGDITAKGSVECEDVKGDLFSGGTIDTD
ncbi:MAG: hypothetical protein HON94_08655 [Methylococcales bacterium]|jgi:cytoskeletal protein CcmA (bactofilin family)|nr:hypothetical protein [Methylococcales bacterium]MBT7410564.1 hypothetical protein [Methylococcales bacterium]